MRGLRSLAGLSAGSNRWRRQRRGLGRGHWGLGAGIPIYTDPRYTVSPAFGTLAIDLIDASRRRMIWEGLVIDVLPPTATPDQWQAVIDSAVQAAFARLPSVTGR